MTWEEYFKACRERLQHTGTSREALHEYNEWRRELRRQICEEEEARRERSVNVTNGKAKK